MSTHATATFEITSWDEKTWDGRPWNEVAGAKVTHAIVKKWYHGDIEGESTAQSLTSYQADEAATYVGIEQLVGQLNGRSGSFILQSSGTYEDGIAKTIAVVVRGSGTGDLRGLIGTLQFEVGHAAPYAVTLDYDFEGT
jgi:hypothetical protein